MKKILKVIALGMLSSTLLFGGSAHAKTVYVWYFVNACNDQSIKDFGEGACVAVCSKIFTKEEYTNVLPPNSLSHYAHSKYSKSFSYYGEKDGYPRWFYQDGSHDGKGQYDSLEAAQEGKEKFKETRRQFKANQYSKFSNYKVIEDDEWVQVTTHQ
ncbi:MAG: hypothetical protein KKD73_07790 [Proteobacteria bacterium]|nr:hypothetical protein [Pseudomonadota bacterium]